MKALDFSSELRKLGWETRCTTPCNSRCVVTMQKKEAMGFTFLYISKTGKITVCDIEKIRELEEER